MNKKDQIWAEEGGMSLRTEVLEDGLHLAIIENTGGVEEKVAAEVTIAPFRIKRILELLT